MEDGMNALERHEAGAWWVTPTTPTTPTIAFPEPKEKCIFASMRFRNGRVLREATFLQRELQNRGYKLCIIDMRSGEDIDEKVFSTIEHCDTFLVFGTHDYGENTGNSASTYEESKNAMNTPGKKIIPLRMIPFNQEFKHLQARVIFRKNLMFSTWIEGQPMPTNVVDDILNAITTTSENPSPTGTSVPNLSPGQRRPVFNAFKKASDKFRQVGKSATTSENHPIATTSENPPPTGTSVPNLSPGQGRPVMKAFKKVRQVGKSALDTAKEGTHKVYEEIKPKTETKTSTKMSGLMTFKKTTTETRSGLLGKTITTKEKSINPLRYKTKTQTHHKENPFLGGVVSVEVGKKWSNARVALGFRS